MAALFLSCNDYDFFSGTFAPFLRASESPMAIACLRLVTFLPLRPLFSLPRFISCISVCTCLPAALPYLRPELFLLLDFFAADFFPVDFLLEDFFAVDFLLLDFFVDFFAVLDFFAEDFLLDDFFVDDFLLAFLVAMFACANLPPHWNATRSTGVASR
jgi:hypothetical protein